MMIFLTSLWIVPLRMIANFGQETTVIVWQNPAIASTKYCRPNKIIFKQEKEFIK